jgi:putative transposase
MAGPLPQAITVTTAQQTVLERLLRQHTCPQALARRVKIVLAAATGQPNEVSAAQLNCSPTTVRLWRRRWAEAEPHLALVDTDARELQDVIAQVLTDAPRPGAPATFSAEQIVQIIALACTPPADAGRPIDAWTPRELADEATKRQIVPAISPSSINRFLKSGAAPTASQPLLAEHNRA